MSDFDAEDGLELEDAAEAAALFGLLIRRAQATGLDWPRVIPPLPVRLPARDADGESAEPGEAADLLLSALLLIHYVDGAGADSVRPITIRKVEPRPDRDIDIGAWCHARGAWRRFLASRIRRAYDYGTGEVLEEPREVVRIFGLLLDAEAATPEGATLQALRLARPGLNVLAYLARCDGAEHPSETEVMLRYLDGLARGPIDERLARRALAAIRPGRVVMERSAKQLRRQGAESLRQVLRRVREMIEADGAISAAETRFLIELNEIVKIGR